MTYTFVYDRWCSVTRQYVREYYKEFFGSYEQAQEHARVHNCAIEY